MKFLDSGWLNGFIGIFIFAGSMPATRIAVQEMSPEFLTGARASIAGIIALILVIILKQPRPNAAQLKSLLIVCLGVAVGFPLFTALAMQHISASYSLIYVALLPLATALFAVMRAQEMPQRKFWLYSIIGSLFVISFALQQSGLNGLSIGDAYMLAAILLCGLGYAEGGALSRELGGWQVICWALVISLPVMLLICVYYFPQHLHSISFSAWMALAYVSLFSMLIGFFFWYKGLALGGIAKISQIQQIQPFIGLILCAFLLHEHISPLLAAVSAAVGISVMQAKKYV